MNLRSRIISVKKPVYTAGSTLLPQELCPFGEIIVIRTYGFDRRVRTWDVLNPLSSTTHTSQVILLLVLMATLLHTVQAKIIRASHRATRELMFSRLLCLVMRSLETELAKCF